jgi:type VI secretion system protein ImpL
MRAWLADARVRMAALAAGAVALVSIALGALTRNWLVALLIALTALLAVLVGLLVRVLIQREREDALEGGVADSRVRRLPGAAAAASSGVLSPEERFAGELDEVRAQLASRGALYDAPWLLLLGESGAGKSALVGASGLDLAARGARRGFEPTRFADVVVANEAIALDTAGRFFRGGERDREEWLRFLGRVRQARPDCAVDGVLAVVPASTLLRRGADLDEEARELRRRLNEIRVTLAVDPPVYLVVAKSDQLEGFAETLRVLPPAFRAQAVGWTNDQRRLADPEARVAEGLSELAARLDGFLPELLLREPDPARQRRMFVFPDQVSALARAVARFSGVAFKRDATSDATPFLRGVYLASARGGEGPGESAFLRELFLDVVRGDDGLALPESRIGPLGRRAIFGAGLIAAAWLLAVWGGSFAQNYQGTNELARRTQRVLTADPSLRDLGDLWTALADDAEESKSAINWLGFDELGRAVERGKASYAYAFAALDKETKRNLASALAGQDEHGVRAAIALATDLDWLVSRAADLDQVPELADYVPQSAAHDVASYSAAYAAYVRWMSERDRQDALHAEQELLASASGRLLKLPVLEEITLQPGGAFPSVRFEDFGLASPGDPAASAVAGIYTKKGNERLIGKLLGAIERTDSVSPAELSSFKSQYADRYLASWRRFFSDVPLAARASADAKGSPVLKLLPEIDRNLQVELPGKPDVPAWASQLHDVLSTSAGVGAFLPGGDPALKELGPPWTAYQKALDAVALDVESASAKGERALALARDVGDAKPTSFSAALDLVGKITRASGDPAATEKLRELLSAPVLDALSALLLSARDELDRRWAERIASRYTGELTSQALAELYAPDSGALAKFVADELGPFYKDGTPRQVLGDRALPFGKTALVWLGRAHDMTAHLGTSGTSGAQAVRLRGVPSTIEGGDGLRVLRRDLRLACPDGEQTFLYREGSGEQTFNWRASCDAVDLRVVLVSAANPNGVEIGREWRGPLALPRFLQDGKRGAGDVYEWTLDSAEGAHVRVRYQLESGTDVLQLAHETPPASLGS